MPAGGCAQPSRRRRAERRDPKALFGDSLDAGPERARTRPTAARRSISHRRQWRAGYGSGRGKGRPAPARPLDRRAARSSASPGRFAAWGRPRSRRARRRGRTAAGPADPIRRRGRREPSGLRQDRRPPPVAARPPGAASELARWSCWGPSGGRPRRGRTPGRAAPAHRPASRERPASDHRRRSPASPGRPRTRTDGRRQPPAPADGPRPRRWRRGAPRPGRDPSRRQRSRPAPAARASRSAPRSRSRGRGCWPGQPPQRRSPRAIAPPGAARGRRTACAGRAPSVPRPLRCSTRGCRSPDRRSGTAREPRAPTPPRAEPRPAARRRRAPASRRRELRWSGSHSPATRHAPRRHRAPPACCRSAGSGCRE